MIKLLGKHIDGAGKAHQVMQSSVRQEHHQKLFNSDMYGTFNIKFPKPVKLDFEPCRKDTVLNYEYNYWPCKLECKDYVYYGYVLKWSGSKMRPDVLEIISKDKFHEDLKTCAIKVEIYEKWSDDDTKNWLELLDRKDRFQGHRFDPLQRSDSKGSWDYFKDFSYEGSGVLDIGCNTGFYSFEAAFRGASVDAVDVNARSINIAKTIQQHIHGTDINFMTTKEFDWQEFNYSYDIIFFLSVYHQLDPSYGKLIPTIKRLKECASGALVLELINPPLEGKLTVVDIDANMEALGGKKVHHYQHKVRRTRSIYLFT